MSQSYNPHAYQKKAIRFLLERPISGLLQDPGLGKTSETYAAFDILQRKGLVKKMLVIAPLRVATSTWPREAQKWLQFKRLNVHVLHGPHKQMLLDQPHDVTVINPEGLGWLFEAVRGRPWPWQMMVVDESTRFKNTRSLRSRTLRPHLGKFRRRHVLTGSPTPNGLLDVYGQVYLLDRGGSLGPTISYFRNEHFDRTGYGGFSWILREGHEEAIYDALKPLVLRMSAEDYLELPPLITNTIEVDLPDVARRKYDELEKQLITAVGDGLVTAANIGVASIKCRQIANGGIYLDAKVLDDGRLEARRWAHIHEAKTEAVQDLVEELGGWPALVAYEFKHDLERLQRAFPDAPYLGGGVPAKRQREIEDAWNAGAIPVLLAQPQSVAHGLNLQGTKAAAVWHSNTFNLEDKTQFDRRIWRQGQKERVYVHSIVARDTVDELIMVALRKKTKVQQALFDALKSYVHRRYSDDAETLDLLSGGSRGRRTRRGPRRAGGRAR